MKKITVTNAESIEHVTIPEFRLKELVVVGGEDMDASDGYHTFTELYDHRVTLFIVLCKKIDTEDHLSRELVSFKEGFAFNSDDHPRQVWRSMLHSNGSAFEGWFILGINKEKGKQITYHLPLSRWGDTYFAETLERAPEWDGHTSADVLERLKTL